MTIEIPGYKILRTLGKGGMATVYLAEQEIFERQVALKVMARSLAEDPAFGQRFMREAKIVSQLVHPNIVNVHDVGMHDGQYYLSMQYIDGQDLKLVRNSLTLEQKIHAIRDIAKALDYAGSKGYIHRDIKPENIIFDSSDGRAILTDFGIAKAAESDLAMTQTGTAIGTPHYMSPEQAKGLTVDKRADIYSLGVVFFLLMSGSLPYDAQSAVAIGIKHITEPVPLLPQELNSIQNIIDLMMAKRVSERYQSASEVVFALDDIDMDVLNHAVRMAVQVGGTQSVYNFDAPTEVATSSELALSSNGLNFPEGRQDNTQEADPDFTVVYHTDDLNPRGYGVIWFVGVCTLFALMGGFLFAQYPGQVKGLFFDAKEYTQNLASQVGLTDNNSPSEALTSTSASLTPVPQTLEGSERDAQRGEVVKEDVSSAQGSSVEEKTLENLSDVLARLEDSATEEAASESEENVPLSELNALTEGVIDGGEVMTETPAVSEEVIAAQDNLRFVKEKFADNPALLPQLVDAYNELLNLQPDNLDASKELDALAANTEQRVIAYTEEGKYTLALKVLDSLQALFTQSDKSAITELRSEITQKQTISDLLVKADAYYRQNQLTRPQGNNAVAFYSKVLNIDPSHVKAKEGLRMVSLRLVEYAERSLAEQDLSAAERYVTQALDVEPNFSAAINVERALKNKQRQLEQIDELLRRAIIAENNRHFYHPRSGSAFSYYQQVLEVENRNPRARQGLLDIYAKFEDVVDEQLAQGQYAEAKQNILRAQKAASQSELLPSLAKNKLGLIEQKIEESTPKIGLVAVTSQPIINLTSNGSGLVALNKEMHVAFTYDGFKSDSTVVQATLLNQDETLQFAQVPTVISKPQGQAQFVFEGNVEGFQPGDYVLYLRANGRELLRYSFEVIGG